MKGETEMMVPINDETYEVYPEEVVFEEADLEQIIDMYLDDIIEIILKNEKYRKALLNKLSKK